MKWLFGMLTARHPAAMVLREVPDAGGAGGGGDAAFAEGADAGQDAGADDGTIDDGAADDVARESAQAADGDDDDLDPINEEEYADLRHDTRVNKLLARTRKLSARDRRATPLVQQLRAVGIDTKDPKANEALLGLIHRARAGENVERLIQQNPRLRSALYGGGDAEPASDGRGARPVNDDLPEDLPFEFDESPFAQFEPGEGTNTLKTIFRAQAQRTHAIQMALHKAINWIRATSRDVGQVRTSMQGERSKTTGQQWESAVNTAAAKLQSPKLQNAFKRAVFGEHQRIVHREKRVPTQDEVINTVLADFIDSGQVTPGQARRVTADAAAQRRAEHNRSLPRSGPAASGAPATPRADRSTETIWDINRRQQGKRYYGGAR